MVACITGAPQGALLLCIWNAQEYREVITDFVDWCERNHLLINTKKTKEMVNDFCRSPPPHAPVNIRSSITEILNLLWFPAINWAGHHCYHHTSPVLSLLSPPLIIISLYVCYKHRPPDKYNSMQEWYIWPALSPIYNKLHKDANMWTKSRASFQFWDL